MSQDHAMTPAAATDPQSTHAQDSSSAHGSFNLSSWALEHRSFVAFMLALIFLFGVASYGKLARSEDPPFTFKIMVVRTCLLYTSDAADE